VQHRLFLSKILLNLQLELSTGWGKTGTRLFQDPTFDFMLSRTARVPRAHESEAREARETRAVRKT